MDEEREDEAIIPEEDFREAIAACCEDPQLERYFRLAPPGAKLFIGLGFYSTHFGDRVDPRQYAECQAEIEPSLTVNDLKYLIRFEDDKGTRRSICVGCWPSARRRRNRPTPKNSSQSLSPPTPSRCRCAVAGERCRPQDRAASGREGGGASCVLVRRCGRQAVLGVWAKPGGRGRKGAEGASGMEGARGAGQGKGRSRCCG